MCEANCEHNAVRCDAYDNTRSLKCELVCLIYTIQLLDDVNHGHMAGGQG